MARFLSVILVLCTFTHLPAFAAEDEQACPLRTKLLVKIPVGRVSLDDIPEQAPSDLSQSLFTSDGLSRSARRANLILGRAEDGNGLEIRKFIQRIRSSYGIEEVIDKTDQDLNSMSTNYNGKKGEFFTLRDLDGELVGSFALFETAPGTIDLRKFYLSPSLRGRGLGEELLREAIGLTKSLGYSTMTLETDPRLTEANRLYEKLGFVPENRPANYVPLRLNLVQ